MLGPREGRERWEGDSLSVLSFPADGQATGSDSVFALDVLRQRLHEKIQEARGQVGGEILMNTWSMFVEWILTYPHVGGRGQKSTLSRTSTPAWKSRYSSPVLGEPQFPQ
jgi:hypothetical protein